MIPAASEDVCTIISIMPIALREDKPLTPSHYFIPACEDTISGAKTLIVKRGSFRVYIDESRPALIVPEPADVIANAVCRDFKVSTPNFASGIAEPGLFWTRNGYTEDEVLLERSLQKDFVKARILQEAWFKALIATADDDWNRNHMRKMISDLQRLACKSLGLDRQWDIDLEVGKAIRTVPCKFCRAEIHPDAVICQFCRGIVDITRYKSDYISVDSFVKG